MTAAALFADHKARILDAGGLELAGQTGRSWVRVPSADLIPVPEGTRLFTLPGRTPAAWDPGARRFVAVGPPRRGGTADAVAAFLPPGYLRLYLPAVAAERGPRLPLWTYTAVGWDAGGFRAAALRIDASDHSEPRHYDDRVVAERVRVRTARRPGNRLLRHLAHCALHDHCLAAKNLFLGRWEAPLPTSPTCNASCAGCLSLQGAGGCAASHERIGFVPTVEEIVETALPHLEAAPEAVVSFGQGCEGEPLLQADLLARAVRRLRAATQRGTIHCNTNGCDPAAVRSLARAGLDSIRVTLNAAEAEAYRAYHRPRGYDFSDVVASIRTAVDHGLFTSLNLLVFPGVTDQPAQVEALLELIRTTGIHMVQMRNLSIDPRLYLELFPEAGGGTVGLRELVRRLEEAFPALEIGYFNRPKERFGRGTAASA